MRTRSSLSKQQREQLIELFEQGLGYTAAANQLGAARDPVRALQRRFTLHGRLCLEEKPTKQQFSFEVKKEVVDRFNAGESKRDLAREFELSSDQLETSWVHAWRTGGDQALRPKPKSRPKGSSPTKVMTEEDRLRREVEKLRAENAYLKKLRDLSNQRRD